VYLWTHHGDALCFTDHKKRIMLVSMTGYGRVEIPFHHKLIAVELRSLNSKISDLRIKIPANYRTKETEIRKRVTQALERGKIDLMIEVSSSVGSGEEAYALNGELFRKYYRELRTICDELDCQNADLVQAIMRIPSVVISEKEALDGEEWDAVCKTIDQAIVVMNSHREIEGEAMEKECRDRIGAIKGLLEQISPLEKEREEQLRQRIWQNVVDVVGKEKIDANRFEQEILYYIEKLDITEEKVRLSQHCDYFLQVLDADGERQKGRKLNFIGQEIGREINTMGAKANYSAIQRIVVQMKDDLEKIKELVANVL
jgi:uncharacterized protein (TIGR00255 family)